jgi:hypothetical protein
MSKEEIINKDQDIKEQKTGGNYKRQAPLRAKS